MFENKAVTGTGQVALDIKSQKYYNKHEKKIPPYCKKLLFASHQGLTPPNDIFVFVGHRAWQIVSQKIRNGSLHWNTLLPNDGSKPNEYIWDFIKGNSVLVFDTGGINYEQVRQLAYELLKAGATVVRFIPLSGGLIVFRRGCYDR